MKLPSLYVERVDKNYIVNNGNLRGDERELFFPGEEVAVISEEVDMWDILVFAGIFRSRTQARKNWKRTERQVPNGFWIFDRIGKARHCISILRATPANLVDD